MVALRRTHSIAIIAARYEVSGYTALEAMTAGQAIVSPEVVARETVAFLTGCFETSD